MTLYGRRTRVVSTVRRRRELSARRARAARELPAEREDDFAWNMQARFSPPRPRTALLYPFFFFFFSLVSGSAKTLYNIDTQLLYIQFARFPRSPRNTGFSPRGFSSALPSTQARGVITTGSGFICAYEPSVFASTFLYFSRFSFFPLPRRMLSRLSSSVYLFLPRFYAIALYLGWIILEIFRSLFQGNDAWKYFRWDVYRFVFLIINFDE